MVGTLPWDYPCLAHMVRVLVCLTPSYCRGFGEVISIDGNGDNFAQSWSGAGEDANIPSWKAVEMHLLVTSHSGGTWQKQERGGIERERERKRKQERIEKYI